MARMIIFTQATMASVVATRKIVRAHPQDVIAIVLSKPLQGASIRADLPKAWKLLKKSSWSFFFYKFIESTGHRLLLTTHRLFRTKRFRTGEAVDIRRLAQHYQVPLITVADLNDSKFIRYLIELKPDYVLCIVGQILKQDLLATLPDRFINAHGSYLPRYRGPAQYFWYLHNNDQNFGITVHRMTTGIDDGDIIFQRQFPIPPQRSAYALHYLIAQQFGEQLNAFIELSRTRSPLPSTPQPASQATTTRLPNSRDVAAFHAAGHRLMTVKDFLHCL